MVQVGAELRIPTARGVLELGPRFEEHLELDPAGVVLEDAGRLHALTPEAGVAYRGLELGLRYRLARTYNDRMMTGAPGDRFQLALDRRF